MHRRKRKHHNPQIMATLNYITKEGVRWDTIAHQAYGDASLMNTIIAANLQVDITEKLPGGIELQIPVIETIALPPSAENLPPWKRNL